MVARHAATDQVAHHNNGDGAHKEAAPRQLLAPPGGVLYGFTRTRRSWGLCITGKLRKSERPNASPPGRHLHGEQHTAHWRLERGAHPARRPTRHQVPHVSVVGVGAPVHGQVHLLLEPLTAAWRLGGVAEAFQVLVKSSRGMCTHACVAADMHVRACMHVCRVASVWGPACGRAHATGPAWMCIWHCVSMRARTHAQVHGFFCDPTTGSIRQKQNGVHSPRHEVQAMGLVSLFSPRITAKIDPACSMGPSLPITKLLATARALPITCGSAAVA